MNPILIIVSIAILIAAFCAIIGLALYYIDWCRASWKAKKDMGDYTARLHSEQFTLNMEAMEARKAMLDEAMKHQGNHFK